MLRYLLLALFVSFLCSYAFRDWFKSLCGLIFLMAVLERPDMPKSIMGIPGLNPFNFLLLFVLMGWISSKKKELREWDMPGHLYALLIIYVSIITLSMIRLLLGWNELFGFYDIVLEGLISPPSKATLFIDHFINCIKFLIPGILVYDGCRTPERARWALYAVLATFLVLGLQVISRMGFGLILNSDALQQKAVRVLANGVGYHRVDLSTLMAGASWCFFCATMLFEKSKVKRLCCLGMSGICFLALLLTAGRAGYGAWAILGVIFAFMRWRVLLLLGPLIIALGIAFVPAVKDRVFEGFTQESHEKSVEHLDTIDDSGNDVYAITSGRALVWPFAIEKIKEAPFFGYGGEAFLRTGASVQVYNLLGAPWGHPHNAYLEFLIDNGIFGMAPVLLLFYLALLYAFRLFKHEDPIPRTVGGVTMALVLTQLIAAVGAQSFYPKEGVVMMWAAIGLSWRFYFYPDTVKNREEDPKLEPKWAYGT